MKLDLLSWSFRRFYIVSNEVELARREEGKERHDNGESIKRRNLRL